MDMKQDEKVIQFQSQFLLIYIGLFLWRIKGWNKISDSVAKSPENSSQSSNQP